MSEDRRIRELARVAREEQRRGVELEARVLGDEGPADGDDEEAFVRSMLAGGGDDEALVKVALEGSRAPETAPAPARLPPRRSRWVPMTVTGLALAAALFLFLRTRGAGGDLPAYESVLEGADAPDRATPSTGNVVTDGASLVLIAKPREHVDGPLEARAFAGCDGTLAKLDVPVTIAPTGAARVAGSPAMFFGEGAHGTCAIAIAIARPGSLPERFADAGPHVVRVDVIVRQKR